MANNNSFTRFLESQQTIVLDGGLATELETQGYDLSSKLWSAELLLNNPDAIVEAHKAYLNAGANCTISASYQASVAGFAKLGLNTSDAKRLTILSVELAIKARTEFITENPDVKPQPLIAASVGPYGATLADGSEYTGNYGISDQALIDFHQQRLQWLDNSDADILACETIPSLQEARVLHDLLGHCQTPSWVSFSCRDGEHLSDGTAITECAKLFSGHSTVKAIGINCTAPNYIDDLIKAIKSVNSSLAIVVYPNSGEIYQASTNSWTGTSSPIECGLAAQSWHNSGANIIGGCCRMGPEHIKEIKQHLCMPRSNFKD